MNLVRRAQQQLDLGPWHFAAWYVGYAALCLMAYGVLFRLAVRVLLP